MSLVQSRSPEPAAEGRTADSRKADALVAVTRHLIFGSHFFTFAQAAGRFALLHFIGADPNTPRCRTSNQELRSGRR